MAVDPSIVVARARRAYEWGRVTRATAQSTLFIVVAGIAVCLGTHVTTSLAVGIVLFVLTCFFGWRGQSLGRSVYPGLIAGLVPFALAMGARSYGHVCTGGECVSLCIPACTVGGLIAGYMIARVKYQTESNTKFLMGASSVALLVGSLGCSCVGYGGIAGLGFGLLTTLVSVSVSSPRMRS